MYSYDYANQNISENEMKRTKNEINWRMRTSLVDIWKLRRAIPMRRNMTTMMTFTFYIILHHSCGECLVEVMSQSHGVGAERISVVHRSLYSAGQCPVEAMWMPLFDNCQLASVDELL